MSRLFWLSDVQWAAIQPHLPMVHTGPRRMDDRRVISGIVYVIKGGLRRRDAPPGYGLHRMLYNRFVRWSRMGLFDRIFAALAGEAGEPDRLIIDSTLLQAHRTVASLLRRGRFPACSGRTKGGLNSNLHAICDGHGRPFVMMLSEGQMNDQKGARTPRLRRVSAGGATLPAALDQPGHRQR